MQDEISRPLIASERQLGYIPTQIVAEYLSEYFGCDAVIYRSAAVGQSDRASRNIVILPHDSAFVAGDAPILAFEDFEVKTVSNIEYKLHRAMF